MEDTIYTLTYNQWHTLATTVSSGLDLDKVQAGVKVQLDDYIITIVVNSLETKLTEVGNK